MPRPYDHDRRQALLDGVIDYIADHGLIELSLRPLAAYLGTSSRMLVYYFGTKEAMLIQALTAQRPDIKAVFAGITDLPSLRERLENFSAANSAGTETRSVRVLLQVLGAAAVPGSVFGAYAQAAIGDFVEALAVVLRQIPDIADPEVTATVLVSGLRGVLQDRLITGDVQRTERAGRMILDRILGPGPIGEARTVER